jgi:membrane-associated phospholipid phosphatase
VRNTSKLVLMVGFVAATSAPVAAQTSSPPPSKSLFTWQDAAMMGGFVIATAALAPVDVAIANRLRDSTVQENRFIGTLAAVVRDVATPYSVVIGVTLYGYGRLARDKKAASLGLHGTEALLIGQLAGMTLKGLFGRERPFVKRDPHSYEPARGFGRGSEQYRSMPSGHTISAFAAAAAVTSETRRWWPGSDKYIGPVMYGGAALAGVSRIYHNRHWATDVMMGAAIGTMAGIKVVRYTHAHPTNALDRWLLSGSASRDASGKLLVRWTVISVLGQ